ncbi:AAA family ATPase [Kiritimatiella glycovorans]|uniref:Cytidylate kinase n=1 Tax=Kiritimatiella glycovorans TaxID=1307763 RepID=A0A0G3EIF5_9BACT|nr:cytidylate kinase-like family protein [Kiritimatiella glycovorans]AKJ65222.1 cytidylate kinase [Kiritimatiella glycovorans]
MKVDLIKYMSDRMQQERKKVQQPGPVVTISRLNGCPAKKVAARLSEMLNCKAEANNLSHSWKWISKEIMAESAKELQMDPDQIKYVFDYEKKSLIDEILNAQSIKYYKSDRSIRSAIGKVIHNIAYEGHVVIVGRGGVAITKHFPKSLHVNLEAPLEWRALRISEKMNYSIDKAREYATDTDHKRKQFREYFGGKGTDYNWFDITFNAMTLSIEEIATTIVKVLELRKMI